MSLKNLVNALLIIGIPFPLVAAPAKNKADAINRFASSLNTLAKRSDIHNPVEVQKLLEVRLKNPDKWSGQPDGTSRRARWRSPLNELGITDVVFNDSAVGANIENSYIHQMLPFMPNSYSREIRVCASLT